MQNCLFFRLHCLQFVSTTCFLDGHVKKTMYHTSRGNVHIYFTANIKLRMQSHMQEKVKAERLVAEKVKAMQKQAVVNAGFKTVRVNLGVVRFWKFRRGRVKGKGAIHIM